MRLFILLTAVLIAGGCSSIRKAQIQRRIEKAKEQIFLHKGNFKEIIATEFPCAEPISNDSAYEQSIGELNEYIETMQTYYDSLLGQDTIKLNPQPVDGIANMELIKYLKDHNAYPGQANYGKRFDSDMWSKLEEKIKNIKPRIDTVRDTRKEQALEEQLKSSKEFVDNTNKANVKYVAKWQWWMWACLITWVIWVLEHIFYFIIKYK